MSGRNPTHGTKVTDPTSEIQENPGAIAADSLAAESTEFSKNKNSTPLGVKGSNSTFANTNTSGATRLAPAPDAEARMAEEDWASERKEGTEATKYPDALGGQVGASEDSASKAGIAPTYVNSQFVDTAGPKGKNLKEGGFDSDDTKNASFNTDIDGKDDPSRLAQEKMFRENAEGGGGIGVPMQKGGMGDNQFENLEDGTDA